MLAVGYQQRLQRWTTVWTRTNTFVCCFRTCHCRRCLKPGTQGGCDSRRFCPVPLLSRPARRHACCVRNQTPSDACMMREKSIVFDCCCLLTLCGLERQHCHFAETGSRTHSCQARAQKRWFVRVCPFTRQLPAYYSCFWPGSVLSRKGRGVSAAATLHAEPSRRAVGLLH
jgi:hypothetical protein